MVELDIPKAVKDDMNSAGRGPWTYFLDEDIHNGSGLTQHFVVEAPKDVARELLEAYLEHESGLEPFDTIETHPDINITHLVGDPHQIHLNILQTTDDHSKLLVDAGDGDA